MVVIVIAGIMISLAVISIGDRSASQLEQEGRRLTALIGMANEEAIMQSREIGLAFSKTGYQFYEINKDDKWTPIVEDETLRLREFPEGFEITLYADGEEVIIEPKMPETPSVYFYSSGETTPFELALKLADYQQIITSDAFGDIKVGSITEQ
jgi:general secretion pathway protein H